MFNVGICIIQDYNFTVNFNGDGYFAFICFTSFCFFYSYFLICHVQLLLSKYEAESYMLLHFASTPRQQVGKVAFDLRPQYEMQLRQ